MVATLLAWSLRLCGLAAGAAVAYLIIYYQLAAVLALWAWIAS